MIGGGMPRGTTTLLLGPTGTGKTVIGMNFLAQPSAEEPSLLFGVYETPGQLIDQAKGLELELDPLVEKGHLELIWQPSTEQLVDDLGGRLLEAVRRRKVKRLFIDGLAGWEDAATPAQKQRVSHFFSALVNEFRLQGITTFYTAETRNLVGPDVEMPIAGISAVVESMILMRYVELEGELRQLLSIFKVRGSELDHRLREFLITPDGVRLGEKPFRGSEALLSSFARRVPGTQGDDPRDKGA